MNIVFWVRYIFKHRSQSKIVLNDLFKIYTVQIILITISFFFQIIQIYFNLQVFKLVQ